MTFWFDQGKIWVSSPNDKRVWRHRFSEVSIRTCLTQKVRFGVPGGKPPVSLWRRITVRVPRPDPSRFNDFAIISGLLTC
ncbi:transposase [Seohaeicola saemankumensis]|nr:transposase [Seohaeicola saemankumensis]